MTKERKLENISKMCNSSLNRIDWLFDEIGKEEGFLRKHIQEFIDLHNEGDSVPGFWIHNGHLYEGHSEVNLDELNYEMLEDVLLELQLID